MSICVAVSALHKINLIYRHCKEIWLIEDLLVKEFTVFEFLRFSRNQSYILSDFGVIKKFKTLLQGSYRSALSRYLRYSLTFSRTIMSPQFTTYLWTDFIASIERCTGNSVYSYQARPAYRNAILFIGKIPSDGIARKITKKDEKFC